MAGLSLRERSHSLLISHTPPSYLGDTGNLTYGCFNAATNFSLGQVQTSVGTSTGAKGTEAVEPLYRQTR